MLQLEIDEIQKKKGIIFPLQYPQVYMPISIWQRNRLGNWAPNADKDQGIDGFFGHELNGEGGIWNSYL